MKKQNKGRNPAIILSIIILLVAVLSLAYIVLEKSNILHSSADIYADIYKDGEIVKTVCLSTSPPDTFSIYGENGQVNVINISDGSIAIIDASCPDKLCVHQGYISSDFLPITCLPNGVVIQIRYDETSEEASFDTVTY